MTDSGPTIALVHAVIPAMSPMQEALAGELPGARVLNLLDEGLLSEIERHGGLAPTCVDRLATHVGLSIRAGAAVVLLTCTAYSSAVPELRERFPQVPILGVDQVMVEQAVARADRIGVLATVPAGLEQQQALLRRTAERGSKAVSVVPSLHPEAMAALRRGDAELHDRILLAALPVLADRVELVLLAQASMARLLPRLPPDLPVPVLASPALAAGHVRDLLREEQRSGRFGLGAAAPSETRHGSEAIGAVTRQGIGPPSGTAAAGKGGRMEALAGQLNRLCDEQPFQTSWFFKDLQSGRTADRRGDAVVPAWSTRKTAILMAALNAVHEGRLRLDQPVTIDETYKDNPSGCFHHFLPGFTLRLHDVLTMMIIVSDNTCTGKVVDLVGLDRVGALCRSVGMRNTVQRWALPPKDLPRDHPLDAVSTTTPADMALLLDLIVRAAADPSAAARLGCTPELAALAIDILSWQLQNSGLPALLPARTKVAHKGGSSPRHFVRNLNDVGIVFRDDRPLFILAVYTDAVPEELPDGLPGRVAASQLTARLSRTCWDALAPRS